MRDVMTAARGLHVVRRPAGQVGAPTTIWVHGYSMRSAIFEPVWAAMPHTAHVGIDLPGHGGSAPWEQTATLNDVADAVAHIVRGENAARLIGLSLGSAVVLQALIDDPECVEHAVLAAPTMLDQARDPAAERRMRQLRLALICGVPRAQLVELWMRPDPDIFTGLPAGSVERARVREQLALHDFSELRDGSLGGVFSSRQTDADLARVSAAVHVVVGDRDLPRFRDYAHRLQRGIAKCRTTVVPGAGHLPVLEQPRRAAWVLRS